MDVKADSLYQEMQAMIGQTQGTNNVAVEKLQSGSSGASFANMLEGAINQVNGMQLESKSMQQAFEMGDRSLSLSDVMVAKEKAGIAFEATIQVRNKVMEAYQEIMRMQV